MGKKTHTFVFVLKRRTLGGGWGGDTRKPTMNGRFNERAHKESYSARRALPSRAQKKIEVS